MSTDLPARHAAGFEPHSGAQAELFRHVSVEKAALYRGVMETFAAAKRQFRLHLRPDEVLAEGRWESPSIGSPPGLETVQGALAQRTEWGNLGSQPDTARVAITATSTGPGSTSPTM